MSSLVAPGGLQPGEGHAARLATLGLLAATATGLLVLPGDDPGFDRYHLPKELWLALCALAIVPGARLVRDEVTRWTLGGVAVVLAATLAATTPLLALRGAALSLACLVLFLGARGLDEREARWLRVSLVTVTAGVALVAIGEVFGWWAGLSATGRAPGSTQGQRNMVAHLCLVVSPAAWALASTAARKPHRALALLAAALLAAGIVVTRSRAAWLTSPVVLLGWLLVSRHRAVVLGATLVAAVAGALLVTPRVHWKAERPYVDTFARLVDTTRGSGRGRLVQYRATLGLVAEHPLLGVGPSNWMVEYPTVSPPGDPTLHATGFLETGRLVSSDALALVAEYGLAALVTLLGVLGLVLRGARRAPAEWPVAVATTLAVVGVGALDAVLQVPTAAVSVALVLGTCARPSAGPSLGRAPRLALAALLVGAAALGLGRLAALQSRSRGGFEHLEAALRWNDADLQARFELAEGLVLAGDCARAAPHLRRLQALLPRHARPRELARACP